MEVASPLSFASIAGTKRSSLACSTQVTEDIEDRVTKRRRFHAAPDVDSLSEDFSSHSLFFKTRPLTNKSIFSSNCGTRVNGTTVLACGPTKLIRSPERGNPITDMKQKEFNQVIQEQATLIESLKGEKSGLEQALCALQTNHERITKENQLLRRAVTIQEERRLTADQDMKSVSERAEERIRNLNQIILSLRYHLHAHKNVGNDFMHQTPPDVF